VPRNRPRSRRFSTDGTRLSSAPNLRPTYSLTEGDPWPIVTAVMVEKRGLTSLSHILARVMKNHSLDKALLQARIEAEWTSAVGPSIAQHAQPDQIRSDKLYVRVDSAPWLQELTMLKPVLIEKVNTALGSKGEIRDMVLRIGPCTPPPAGGPSVKPDSPSRIQNRV
jgi:hypothetical protein